MNDRPIHHVCYIVDDIPTAVEVVRDLVEL